MTPATQQWPPWPIEVGQVMATATLELGVQGFEHGDDISIDGGDYGRGCRVFKLTSKDHPEYPKWCVSIEIPDRLVGNEAVAKAYRQKMLDFVRDVVHRPGWSNAMRMATCEDGHPIYWQHVYSKSGGYAGSVLAYLVYDAAIAERDKGKEPPVVKDSSWRGTLEGVVRHHTARLDQINARVQDCETTTAEKVLDLRHLITTMNLEIQKVRADTDRLCREADAKKFYATPAAPDPTAAWRSDSDSKDALIRDLMTWVSGCKWSPARRPVSLRDPREAGGQAVNERKVIDRRKTERRAPKPGVNVRYSDKDNGPLDVPKRVRLGKLKKP